MLALQCSIPKLYAIYLIGLSDCTASTVDKLASGFEGTCYARFRFSGRQSEISFDIVSVWRYHRARTQYLPFTASPFCLQITTIAIYSTSVSLEFQQRESQHTQTYPEEKGEGGEWPSHRAHRECHH